MAEREVILGDAVYYDHKGTQRTANRGDVLDLSDSEVERLEALEAIGPVGTVAAADAVPGADGILSDLDDEQLAEWVESHNTDEVIEHAGTPELAQRLLDSEQARDKPRKGVIDGISKALGALA
jgi:hypothetical protein